MILQLATTLKYLVEDNPRYRVVAIADDADNAVAAAEHHNPDLALVDLHLARGSTGFSAAVRLSDYDVPCLFVSGKAPSFPMPDLALGCLMKPFTAEEVHRALEPGRGQASRPRDRPAADSAEPSDLRCAGVPRLARAGFHPVTAVAAHPDRALDRGPAPLGPT